MRVRLYVGGEELFARQLDSVYRVKTKTRSSLCLNGKMRKMEKVEVP